MTQIRINAVPVLPASFTPKLVASFKRVINSKTFLEGSQNRGLAQSLKTRLSGGNVIPVANGHDALVLALQSLGVRPKDDIILPALAYPTAFAVWQSGARVLPVDVDANGQLSPATLAKALTPRTKAVVVVHLYGHIGDVRAIKRMLKKKRVALVEDASQAFGGRYQRKPVGTLGDIGCFSFYPTKNLGALGHGGALWTKHKAICAYLAAAKSYGEKTRYASDFPSFHSELAELQAAGLNVFLRYFGSWSHKRRKLFAWYEQLMPHQVHILTSHQDARPVPLELAIVAPKRDHLASYLGKKGIETVIHYPTPFPFVPAFRSLGFKRGDFPMSERLAKQVLSLPLHPFLTESEVRYISGAVKEFYEAS